jgi:excisionase family DNA binding protein
VKKSEHKNKVVQRKKMKIANGASAKAAGNGDSHHVSAKFPKEPADQILTVPMLAEYLLCHPSTIYRLLKNKRIPGFRVGSDWRFRRSAIDQWLNKATIPSARV